MKRARRTERIRRVLLRTLDDLPLPLRDAMNRYRVTVDLLPEPPPDLDDAFGSFCGSPIQEFESWEHPIAEPPRIEIYVSSFEDIPNSDEFEEEIRLTLIHELGHFLGFDEDDLADV